MVLAAARDWNAADAGRAAPHLALPTRLALWLSSPRAALRGLDAIENVDRDDLARAQNVLEGLADRAGVSVPEFRVYRGAPNAMTVPQHRPVVAVSERALADMSRTELEGLLAHCVVRIAGARRSAPVGYDDDVRAVALTRYPPGLAKALEKLEPRRGSGAHWFTAADAPSHRRIEKRIAALEEL